MQFSPIQLQQNEEDPRSPLTSLFQWNDDTIYYHRNLFHELTSLQAFKQIIQEAQLMTKHDKLLIEYSPYDFQLFQELATVQFKRTVANIRLFTVKKRAYKIRNVVKFISGMRNIARSSSNTVTAFVLKKYKSHAYGAQRIGSSLTLSWSETEGKRALALTGTSLFAVSLGKVLIKVSLDPTTLFPQAQRQLLLRRHHHNFMLDIALNTSLFQYGPPKRYNASVLTISVQMNDHILLDWISFPMFSFLQIKLILARMSKKPVLRYAFYRLRLSDSRRLRVLVEFVSKIGYRSKDVKMLMRNT